MAKGSKIVIEIDAQTAQAIRNIQKFQRSSNKSFSKVKKGLDVVSKALVAAGTAAAGAAAYGFVKATKAAIEFETALAEIDTILPDTGDSINQVSKDLLEFQSFFGGKATSQAKSYYQIISAGITDTAQASNVLLASNKLAIGGLAELPKTVDIVTTVLNNYKDSALDAEKISDVLFTTVKNGKTTVGELADFLGKVLPNSSQLGVSFEEVAASLTALTARGISTAQAVTNLRALFTGVANGQERAANTSYELADAFSFSALKAKGLGQFVNDVRKIIGNDDAGLQKLLGSVEAVTAFNTLAANSGEKFSESLKDIANSAGAADAAFERINETAGQQISVFSGLIEQIGIASSTDSLGEFSKILKDFNNVLRAEKDKFIALGKKFAGVFVNFIKIFARFSLGVAKFTNTIISDIENAFTWLAKFTSSFGAPKNPDKTYFKELTKDMKEFAKSYKAIEDFPGILSPREKSGIKQYREQYRAYKLHLDQMKILNQDFNEVIAKNNAETLSSNEALTQLQNAIDETPIDLDVKAEIKPNEIKKQTKKIEQQIKKDPIVIPIEIAQASENVQKAIREGVDIPGLTRLLDTELKKLFNALPDKDGPLIDKIFDDGVIDRAKTDADVLLKYISDNSSLFPTENKKVQSLISALQKGADDAGKLMADRIEEAFEFAGEALEGIAQGAKDTTVVDRDAITKQIFSETNAELKRLGEAINEAEDDEDRQKAAAEFEQALKERDQKIEDAIKEQTAENKKVAKEAAVGLVTAVGAGVADAFLPGLGQVVGPLLDMAANDPEQLQLFIDNLVEALPVVIENIIENAPRIALAIVLGIIGAMANLVKSFMNFLAPALKDTIFKLLAFIGEAFRGVFQWFINILNEALMWIVELPKMIGDGLMSVFEWFIDGITSVFDWFLDAFEGVGDFAKDTGDAIGDFFSNTASSIGDFFGFNQGGVVHANAGYRVPGVGGTDTVPAMLTPGEVVIPNTEVNSLENYMARIAQQAVGANNGGGSSTPIVVQVMMNDEVFAETMVRVNQDNQRLYG